MSVVAASDFLTDEELEDLREDGLSVVTYMSDTEKRPRKKKTSSSKPPPSPKSPYLSSANLHSKKTAVWRSLKGTGMMHGENPTARTPREFWLASIKSGIALSQPMKVDYDATPARMSASASTPEYLKEALGMKKPKHSRSSNNGYIPGTPDFKDKEDMYDEIIELKKCLQAQKSESDLMKTKLRRLEEDNIKKEKQIEQLLDPTKGCEYTRALVDKRNDGSAVMNGLKQKILKLEQQCKEKDSILTKLQSDIKTTNMEEMKIALETYFEEIQRLRVLLANAETAERSNRAESKESMKQQKVLNSTIMRLSKNIKQLQEENKTLKEELERTTESSSGTVRGYSEWSKQRLVRRITELEKETDSAGSAKATHVNTVATCTDLAAQGVTATPSGSDQQECARLRGLVKKLREERAGLQESLAERMAEIKLVSTEKAEAVKDVERLKISEQEASSQKEEIERLTEKLGKLEKELVEERHLRAELQQIQQSVSIAPSGDAGGQRQDSPGQGFESPVPSPPAEQESHHGVKNGDGDTEDKAARTIQRHWHQYRIRNEDNADDFEESHQREYTESGSAQGLPAVEGDEDDDIVTLLQSALRGHLARLRLAPNSDSPKTEISAPTPAPRRTSAIPHYQSSTRGVCNATGSGEEEIEEDIPGVTGIDADENLCSTDALFHGSLGRKAAPAHLDLHQPTEAETAKAGDSDDSDDIIVSPSRPVRRKDSYF
ncbi:hypothetical protein JZ751_026174 [Albula glossodonta]|uniref:IQ domain-containing protein E n=1 Tax=Albula glossodonta TaxID=121402 RepID=A0A8T2PF53_9TELE|nr:hypothetical protein JZ751_026174 [Albula glossodonta]